ncbi:MAG: hypothetical protein HKN09_13290 [Saprospiraceae bacterium]|nr:hypothetical protein [Saprospiraceae bacterium]
MIRISIIACFIVFMAADLVGQLPSTDIYHFTIVRGNNGIQLDNPQYLTGFNEDGYNNQPLFFDDDVVYFTTDYYDSLQTEIAKFDLGKTELTRITTTQESEYSPTPIPNSSDFSCVRVELNNIQTLTSYPLDGMGVPERYLTNIKNVGYHCWLNANDLALFLVKAPEHQLAICEIDSEKRKIILDKIGRCLIKTAQGELMFVHKLQDENWYIKSYNLETSQSSIVCQTPNGSEDFALLPAGSLLMGQGSKLMRYNPGYSTDWELVQDLGAININSISRITIRNNRLVLVNQKT